MNTQEADLKTGHRLKSGYVLTKKIESLDEFINVINTQKSIFARHKIYPCSFLMNWKINLVKNWIDRGWIFQFEKEK